MARSNPLMNYRLEPLGGQDTSEHFRNRMRAMQDPNAVMMRHTLNTASRVFSHLAEKMSRTSAPLHLNVAPEDLLPADSSEGKEDLENILAAELTQDPDIVQTYVENLKTGRFQYLNNNLEVFKGHKPTYKPLTDDEKEAQIYVKLEAWSYRLHRFFFILQGFLAGVALLHLFLIWRDSDEEFVVMYSPLAQNIGTLFLVLTFFAFIGMIHRTLNENRHYKKALATRLEIDVSKDRMPYLVAWVCMLCYGLGYVITVALVPFVNRMHFRELDDPGWAETESISSEFADWLMAWGILCTIREVLAIIAWILICIQQYWNIGSVYRFRLEELLNKETVTVLTFLQRIYRHLFFGNPYLPYGVYETEVRAEKKPKKLDDLNKTE